jgi:hypothetical protein
MTFFVLLSQQTKEREMKTTCTRCGKKYQQSESYENTYKLPALCVRCALIELTADGDSDQEPTWFDIENAWARSGQATDEELDEIAEEHRRQPDRSTDEEEPEWCHCNSYICWCSQCKEDGQREQESEMEELYWEAVEEDQARSEIAEQAQWDAEITEWEKQEAYRNEFYDSFSEFWCNVFGWTNYNRFVAPILIGWLRFKKRWRQ